MKRIALWFGTVGIGLHAGLATAGPASYVFTPKVEQGVYEMEVNYGTNRSPAGERFTAFAVGLGYGMSEHWYSAISLKQEHNGNQSLTIAEWENKFHLGKAGAYPVDFGFITEVESPISGNGPSEIKFGPLLQSDFGKLQLNGNVLFERAFGQADEQGVPFVTNIGYQWQARYRLRPTFGFGLQGMGEMGKWNDWDARANQNHRAGIVLFGKIELAEGQEVKVNAASLFGISNAAPGQTFRMQLEYEF
ncbi:MAG: hypothetical protein IPM27_08615 [Nitrosomonadales bacterium]|nr:hypothetical protein [Nitrosomonadales bacterium]